MDDFAEEVMAEEGTVAWRDFSSIDDAIKSIKEVLRTLAKNVLHGDLNDILDALPKQIANELRE